MFYIYSVDLMIRSTCLSMNRYSVKISFVLANRIYDKGEVQIYRTVTKRVKSLSITIVPLESFFIIHYTLLFHNVFVF